MSVILLTPGNLSLFLSYDGIVDDNVTVKCLRRVAMYGAIGCISIGWNKKKNHQTFWKDTVILLKYHVRYFQEAEM